MINPPRHLAILAPNWLGDVVMAQPAMHALYEAYPDARISLTGRAWLADLLPFLNLGSATYSANPPENADMAVLLRNSFSAAREARRAGIAMRIGFRGQWRRLLLTHPFRPHLDMATEHHRLYFLDLIEQMGIVPAKREVSMLAPQAEREAGAALMRAHDIDSTRAICVAPGAQFGGAKRYPHIAYAEVLAGLSDAGWQPIILGTPEERAIAEATTSGIRGASWNATGQTSLRQALQVVAAARLMLCNDSGLMHVAAGLGIPTVGLFGATDPERTAPSGPVTILYNPAGCSPCLQRECTVAGHPCMANLKPAAVLAACLERLAA
jgi:heptosyltransferase-2